MPMVVRFGQYASLQIVLHQHPVLEMVPFVLWNVQTRRQDAILKCYNNHVQSVCFSPDGTTLASGSDDKHIKLWNLITRKFKLKLCGHTSLVNSFCFSSDSATLASGSDDKSIRIWHVQTGQQIAKLEGHDSFVNSVCFSPDGTLLASYRGILNSGKDCYIRLWDFKTGYQILDSDKNLKDILAQLKLPHQANSLFHNTTTPITILLISQKLIFQAEGALIFNGYFMNQLGIDLGLLLKQKGSYLFEGQNQFLEKQM
ncbi:unnamed protein product [Paramecium pentaurelia]|uniref:Uncharacterized protein n=1 Tax=Paramecium pentaurelia TaxID=43138 RepID=A0A8S1V477_9CILI|nr:unnamed protein product [Paramecium pentaurelia]